MAKNPSNLDVLQIASPCSVLWDHRVSRIAAAVFATLATCCAATLGQTPWTQRQSLSRTPQAKITTKGAEADPLSPPLTGTVLDPNGAVIAGATITINNSDSHTAKQAFSNYEGRFQFLSVTEGNYSLTIEMPGFRPYKNKALLIETGQLTSVEVTLLVSPEPELVGMLILTPGIDTVTPGTTIISDEISRRLPIDH